MTSVTPPPRTPAEWAGVIRADMRRSVEAIVAAGRHLAEAKEDIPHGQWEPWLHGELGMNRQTAAKLMAIARHPVLADVARLRHLPPSAETLYVLSQLPAGDLAGALEAGTVTPATTRDQAVALRPPHAAPNIARPPLFDTPEHRAADAARARAEPGEPITGKVVHLADRRPGEITPKSDPPPRRTKLHEPEPAGPEQPPGEISEHPAPHIPSALSALGCALNDTRETLAIVRGSGSVSKEARQEFGDLLREIRAVQDGIEGALSLPDSEPGYAYSPRLAADAAKRLSTVHGCKARYVPDLTPPAPDPWPISTHETVRVEAWAITTDHGALAALHRELAALPGAIASGMSTPDPGHGRPLRRPWAWVELPGHETPCTHTREGWTHGRS
jgi:hypothetical protein